MKRKPKSGEKFKDEPATLRRRITQLETLLSGLKKSEESLRRSEEKYRLIAENTSDYIATITLKGIITYVSPSFRQLGYEPDRLLGKSAFDLIHVGDRGDIRAMLRKYSRQEIGSLLKLKRDGIYERGHFRFAGPSKNWYYIEAMVNLTENPDSGGFDILMIGRDVTEQKRREQLLQALNNAAAAMETALTVDEIFSAVSDEFRKLNLTCMIFPLDHTGSRLYTRYLSYESRVLKAAEKLVGQTHEDFSFPVASVEVFKKICWGKKAVFVPDSSEIFSQVFPKASKMMGRQIIKMLKVSRYIAVPLIVKDKITGVFSVQSDNLVEEDKPAIIAFANQVAAAWRKAELMQDLNDSLEELKQIQDQLLQSQKMEAIGRLAGGIAHDFNNLLTVILGYTGLILAEIPDYDPQVGKVSEIQKAAEQAAVLTGRLLAFSRKQVLQPRIVNLNSVVSHIEQMIQRLIGEDIRLEISLAPDLRQVKVDPGQVEQVIMNLVTNSRDAMPAGGRLTIETANVEVNGDRTCQDIDLAPGSYAVLRVGDTGIGIDSQTAATIFEPFFTTKKNGKGTGLGLSMVYGIVKQSGGHITVHSEPGRYTHFDIYFPIAEAPGEAQSKSDEDSEFPGGMETILLVEDEDLVRDLVVQVLRRSGYNVLSAGNGEEALRVYGLQKRAIRLIIADVVLPDINGYELVTSMARDVKETKVLYISGYPDSIAFQNIHRSDAPFLPKPFDKQTLLATIRKILDSPPPRYN